MESVVHTDLAPAKTLPPAILANNYRSHAAIGASHVLPTVNGRRAINEIRRRASVVVVVVSCSRHRLSRSSVISRRRRQIYVRTVGRVTARTDDLADRPQNDGPTDRPTDTVSAGGGVGLDQRTRRPRRLLYVHLGSLPITTGNDVLAAAFVPVTSDATNPLHNTARPLMTTGKCWTNSFRYM